jgi:hypothetical protein
VDRDLKREVTVRRPSRLSKVRVLIGVSIRAVTSVRRVADWIAGQLKGSRRSRRSYMGLVLWYLAAWSLCTYVHVLFSGKERLAGRM